MAISSRRMVRSLCALLACVVIVSLLPESLFSTTDHHSQRFVDVIVEQQPKTYRIPVPQIRRKKKVEPAPEPATPVLEKHRFRSDGLLEVNLNGPHPIYELMSRAEKTWKSKLNHASRTLEEAVEEYTRRYNRPPPKGFDHWWDYVVEHNVQLPDEYDQIFNDLEPFWGIEPEDLIAIQQEAETKKDSYTVGKTEDGDVDVLTYAFEEGRYQQLIVGSRGVVSLLREVQDYLPPFRATFSPHDGPNRMSDYNIKKRVLDAAASNQYVRRADLPKISGTGWRFACAPDSLPRRRPPNLDEPPPRPAKKTFIHDHVRTMDPCIHPNHFHQHGQFLSHNMGPTPQDAMVPEFAQCSTTLHHNIRYPTPYGWVEDIYPRSDDPPFDDKIDDRLSWRGRNTGIFHSSTTLWQNSQRDFLVGFANELEGSIKLLPPNVTETEPLGGLREMRKSRLNPAVMDIAFAEGPIACSESTCKELEAIYPFRPYQGAKEAGQYKYVIDVDGNGWSGRFKRLMTSNALIFKSTLYPEWYADRIQPWLHYVPIQLDLSDLHDALVFFRGDGNGEGAHEDLARTIAVAGREWSKTFWRKEDLVAYFFRLILEYARLMSKDREAMSFVLSYDED
ncbi:hypothetical protein CC2G_003257 [Coprinopsis cinerea AmutBmut pab1-1]|nr:hypothetical protein CC2G_003257 [Coprinopsis cinerea AmutBmut pab1-1]